MNVMKFPLIKDNSKHLIKILVARCLEGCRKPDDRSLPETFLYIPSSFV